MLGEWVDFSYEVNGKVYGFTMQGADTVSLRALIEALHVYEKETEETEVTNEELSEPAEVSEDSPLDKFMAEIENVTFSDTSLLVPAFVEEDATAGQIKTDLKLFPSYPLGLTQDEVLALNEKEYKEGDWILISMKAFDTAETLTVSMKNGNEFYITVTDAQDAQMIGDEVLTVSNPAGTTIDLFDYWVISQDLVGRDGWGDLDQGRGYDEAKGLNGTGNNKGINSRVDDPEHGHALKFSPAWEGSVYNGSKNNWTSMNLNGRDGLSSYTGNGNPFQGIVSGALDSGYPVLTQNDTIGSNGESLAYLFDPGIGHDGKASYAGVDHLLYVDKNGYYTYDSRDYRADYKEDGTFKLTEQTDDDTEIRGFWPFGTQNFWVGMHVNAQFSMPVNGRVLNPRGEYRDMQFEFSGDDDTWLYVDGVLVGDGGGIHNRTEIDINFATGKVTVTGKKAGGHSGDFEETKYLDEIFINAGKYNESDWEDIGDGSGHKRFKAGTYHSFDMFYLERGGGESNLYIHYNLVSTADFTAHKSYKGYDDDDVLQRNQFRFELEGLDGRYRSVWSDAAKDYVLEKVDDTSRAIMPHASSSGAGTVVSPYYNANTSETLSDGTSVPSQTYITGNTEDGNVNFGSAEISEQDMHDCDEGNSPVYRYIVRETVPDDAVNSAGITWAEATDEQKAAGGFVKDSVNYDGTVYYMSARVTSWQETDASGQQVVKYGLSKTYYTDDTYTVKKTDVKFIDFRNKYTEDYADLEFNKINAKREPVEGAVFGLFRDSACKIPAKGSDNNQITAVSSAQGKVKFENVRTGIYFMKEISVPEPYETDSTVYRATISRQGSRISVHTDQANKPVTEIINTKPTDITVIKKWLDAHGNETSGEKYPATVQLRRYHYVRTGPEPETHNVLLHFHFPDMGWNDPNKDFGPYTVTGNSVAVYWYVGGAHFYSDQAYTQPIHNESGHYLLELPLTNDIEMDIYCSEGWASNGLNSVSADGTYDDSKELRPDDAFPQEGEEHDRATKLLTQDNPIYAWSIGMGEGYDFASKNDIGDYLYYVVELDAEGNAVPIDGDAAEGLKLFSIEYNTELIEGKGIQHGLVTVTNQLAEAPTIDVDIKKVDGAEDSEHYLAGAIFKLLRQSDSGTSYENVPKDEVPQLNNKSEFTVPAESITLTGLTDGNYKLVEVSPPNGYVIMVKEPVFFTVSNASITSTEGTNISVKYYPAGEDINSLFVIPNDEGVALPKTGGSGTGLLNTLGGILILSAGYFLLKRTR